jgi:hypothetical protein
MPVLESALLGFIDFCLDPKQTMENGLNNTIQNIKKSTIPNHLKIEDAFTALNSLAKSNNPCEMNKFIETGQELINTLRELINSYTINKTPYLKRLTEIETILNNRTNPNNVINEKKLVKMYLMENNDNKNKYYEIGENYEKLVKDYGEEFYYIIENGGITEVGNLFSVTTSRPKNEVFHERNFNTSQFNSGKNNITFKFKNGEKIMEYTIDDLCGLKLRVYKIRQDILPPPLHPHIRKHHKSRSRSPHAPQKTQKNKTEKVKVSQSEKVAPSQIDVLIKSPLIKSV